MLQEHASEAEPEAGANEFDTRCELALAAGTLTPAEYDRLTDLIATGEADERTLCEQLRRRAAAFDAAVPSDGARADDYTAALRVAHDDAGLKLEESKQRAELAASLRVMGAAAQTDRPAQRRAWNMRQAWNWT